MKTKNLPKSFVYVMLVMPALCFAWNSTSTVAGINVYDDGHVVARFTSFPGTNICGSNYFSLGRAGSPQQKAMFAAALAALAGNKQVSVTSAPSLCNGGEEIISALQILP